MRWRNNAEAKKKGCSSNNKQQDIKGATARSRKKDATATSNKQQAERNM